MSEGSVVHLHTLEQFMSELGVDPLKGSAGFCIFRTYLHRWGVHHFGVDPLTEDASTHLHELYVFSWKCVRAIEIIRNGH